ncbi:MAG TPA: ribosome silencing factor [bacterium]|nr:ribosome silencing factor [bacterium]HPR87346.1 ribosome silencing factor [bacterium]
MESQELARRVARLIWEKKGIDPVIMDLRQLTSITDFFVICSVDSDPQARAIMDHLAEQLGTEAVRPWHVEGSTGSKWLLLDFVDVVVHIFRPEARNFYGLERLWGDAPIEEITEHSFSQQGS